MIHSSVSPDILPKALLTIYDIWGRGRIDREHALFALVAVPFVKLPLAPQCHTLPVAAGWAMIGERQILLLVEVLLGRDDDKVLATGWLLALHMHHNREHGHRGFLQKYHLRDVLAADFRVAMIVKNARLALGNRE